MEAIIRGRDRTIISVQMGLSEDKRRRNPYDSLRTWSAVTHGVGAIMAILGTIALSVKSFVAGCEAKQMISLLVYGISMVCLYTASTLYHSLRTDIKGRVMLRKFDHSSIYFLIAGTYTPICLIVLRGQWGQFLMGTIWVFAVAGVFLTLLWINCPRCLSAAIYIAMGWTALFAIRPISQALGKEGMFWLLLGGILYSVGGVLYALKWPGKNNPKFGCHEIFHVFVLLGSVAHFVLIYKVVI